MQTEDTSIATNIKQVQEKIADACARAGRDADAVTLIAVSKKKPVSDIVAAIDAGLRHFGENRVEESQEKIPQVKADAAITWHMIGHIQSRKVRHVVPLYNVVHSVDTVKLAERLSRQVSEDDPDATLNVLLQINISGEGSKGGLEASGWKQDNNIRDTLWQQVDQILQLPCLNVRGLMTMAPIVPDSEQTRPIFAGLAELRDEMAGAFKVALPELSMGMTDDYPVALEEGATMVRIGRAIFGERLP